MKDDKTAFALSLLMLGLLFTLTIAGCSTICGVNLGVPIPGCPTPIPTPEVHAAAVDYDVAVEANR